jgi:biopolymer transport protein ExbD
MRLPEEPDTPFQINIVPMIDVIFAILTFFIMSSLFLTRSTGLPVTLPNAQTAQNQPTTRVTVTLNQQGQIFLNENAIALKALQPQLKALVGNRPTLVIINADQKAAHGAVVAVMDQLRQIPTVSLAIAAQQ